MEHCQEIDGDDAEPNSRTEVIAEVFDTCYDDGEADARLIAAAPDLLAAAEAARLTLAELAQHPAFAGDAPEFNKGGIGYEAGQKLCSVIKAAKGGGRC